MILQPPYSSTDIKAAYRLRYTWMGWPKTSPLPAEPDPQFFQSLADAWETDGIRLLEYQWSPSTIKILASVIPQVSPVFFAARMKGRLQHGLRQVNSPAKFKRNFAMRTVGENDRRVVEQYIINQVVKASYADPRMEEFLNQFTFVDDRIDLSIPSQTTSGQYWYDLHLVLVVRNRWPIFDEESLQRLSAGCFRIAQKKGHQISRLAIMPDHLHCALRGTVEQSPEEIALAYMNNLAHLLGDEELWQSSYYVGSFGEYNMNAIRQCIGGIALSR